MKRHFSKIFAMLLVLSMLLTQLIIPASAAPIYCGVCGEAGVKGPLLHTIDPTCGTDGFEIYDCVNDDCEGTITVRVAATGVHKADGNVVPPVEPTCTEEGALSYELCVDCGCYLDPTTHAKLDTIVVPKNGHSYDDTVTPPTCTDGGFTTHVCSVCGDTYKDAEVGPTSHKFDKDVEGKKATCREEGYTAYVVCSVCGVEDPENKKTVLPIEDHNLKIVEHVDPTCTEDGKNVFKCDVDDCPYYNGITEVLKAPGHKIVKHDAKAANCKEGGHGAYETCEVCDYTTYDASTEVPPLGHTEVSVGYIAPTCTEIGYTDAIVCDRCGFVHHPGEEIAATGHNLTLVPAQEAHCNNDNTFTKGNEEHKKCNTCEKLFDTTVENDDIDAVPLALTDVEINIGDHDWDSITIAAKCTENGYVVKTCKKCKYTTSTAIKATGHTFTPVEEVPAKCLETGVAAHNKCDACGKLFAKDADASDIKIAEVTLADLTIAALGHKPMVVEKVNPTYDAAGNEAGEKCERCDAPLVNANTLDELKEAVNFYYDINGINGVNEAVNSGYITVDVYFDVLKDALDTYADSDVLANIFAIKYDFEYDTTAFEYVKTSYDNSFKTLNANVNTAGKVEIVETMGTDVEPTRGNVHFATITFKVLDEAVAGSYNFNGTAVEIEHYDGVEVIAATYVDADNANVQSATFEVIKLGDAKVDGNLTTSDARAFMDYFRPLLAGEEVAYETVFDMDKDGEITMTDYQLLIAATVGNEDYLAKEAPIA